MLSEHMMTMWSKFSKQDDPSDHSSDEQSSETISVWPKFEAPDWKFLNFEDENLDIGQDQRERVCLFWDRYCINFQLDICNFYYTFRIIPQFLPPKPDRLMKRSLDINTLSCKNIESSRLYFPGFRSVPRL